MNVSSEVGIYYTYYESPIGLMRIGGTQQYISDVNFVDSAEDMLHGEPGISDLLHLCTEQLIEFFQGRRKSFDLPVHQDGTEFQQSVWAKVMHLPFGKTCSYKDLALQVSNEKAVRAVAATNARNRIMLLIPCHRIIGTDKNLTGYRGGMWRKKWLLQHEFRIQNGVQLLF